jgi:hypothetical protein
VPLHQFPADLAHRGVELGLFLAASQHL